jgi:hypothetical protein
LPDLAKLTTFDGECAIAAHFIGKLISMDKTPAVAGTSCERKGLKENIFNFSEFCVYILTD